MAPLTIRLATVEANVVLFGLFVNLFAHGFLLQVEQVPLVQDVQKVLLVFGREQHVAAFLN